MVQSKQLGQKHRIDIIALVLLLSAVVVQVLHSMTHNAKVANILIDSAGIDKGTKAMSQQQQLLASKESCFRAHNTLPKNHGFLSKPFINV